MEKDATFRIEISTTTGRFMVSSRALKEGETVIEGIPYAVVVDNNFRKITCNVCLKNFGSATANINREKNKEKSKEKEEQTRDDLKQNEDEPVSCNYCKDIWYCSSKCKTSFKRESYHTKEECQMLKKINNPNFKLDVDTLTDIRLVIRSMCRRFHELEKFEKGEDLENKESLEKEWNILINLASNRKTWKGKPQWPFIEKGQQLISKIIPSTISKHLEVTTDLIQDMICQVKCNSFGIWNKRRITSIALATYPNSSLYNHSCAPNCVRIQNGTYQSFQVLYDIAEGTELTIGYCELDSDYEIRQAILEAHYHFTCSCVRCASKDSEESLLRISPYFCPEKGCAGLLAYFDKNSRVCNSCGYVQRNV